MEVNKEASMSLERIIWLVVGIVLIVAALLVWLSDGITIDQEDMDACQNVVLGVFALGMAYRSR